MTTIYETVGVLRARLELACPRSPRGWGHDVSAPDPSPPRRATTRLSNCQWWPSARACDFRRPLFVQQPLLFYVVKWCEIPRTTCCATSAAGSRPRQAPRSPSLMGTRRERSAERRAPWVRQVGKQRVGAPMRVGRLVPDRRNAIREVWRGNTPSGSPRAAARHGSLGTWTRRSQEPREGHRPLTTVLVPPGDGVFSRRPRRILTPGIRGPKTRSERGCEEILNCPAARQVPGSRRACASADRVPPSMT